MTSGDWPAGLLKSWHPVAYADEIGRAPVPLLLMDRPLVAFRSQGEIALLEDRCPHRNAPLSKGRAVEGAIECPYHGWRFGPTGKCARIAGTDAVPDAHATPLPIRVSDGLVWTTFATAPDPIAVLPAETTDPGFDSFWWKLPPSRGAIGDAIENLVDPVHAYFLHPGLVRRATAPKPIEVELMIEPALCTARYTEPPESLTWLQRLTEGRRTTSSARYWPPTIVQIAFSDARGVAATITVVFAPVGRTATRPYACFSTRHGLLPAALKRAFIIVFHRRVLDQDLAMLQAQADIHDRFGGPSYRIGPLDLFGPAIWNGLNGLPFAPQHRKLRMTGRS
jgi:phenylpropionate dioxygenase-like ring-hydroxylating dioxygenase large terminal subunit